MSKKVDIYSLNEAYSRVNESMGATAAVASSGSKSQPHDKKEEDEETIKNDILNQVAEGLKKVIEIIEKYKSSSRTSKNIKLPENSEDSSWVPSLK